MNSKKMVMLTSVFIVAIVAIVFLLNKEDKSNQSNQTNTNGEHPPTEQQPTLGNADATVSIVEFGDYKCPACKAWGEQVFPQLEEEFIKTGKAKFSYINVLFHGKESALAALASESVFKQDPESFWAYHNAVFAAQPATQEHDNQWVTPEKLIELAKENVPNIDLKQLEENINNEGTIEEVKKDDDLVKEFNVEVTPTIIINGVMLEDPFDYEAIVSLIEAELEKKNE